ncbi:MAG: TetR/AcrR family transcriptional regulator [Aquabacterium sp.]|uniref:TetR/AcrR family transcriptional regulator n=1 Tax=Aquabacterium sp. TaxID=1872578 RepID=UPI0025BA3476|nr:TetR/AcrR family transcriptional regulator [Aquabacterium sp.]MBI5926073.1 TetR/AcrR family transcriptional regulator [Aquabacterium sp.]
MDKVSSSSKAALAAATEHRQRLLDGLADALQTQAFAEITIADIVAKARVSKRTFYEQFASKEACLLALGERLCDQTLALIAANYRFDEDWITQLRNVTHAYLSSLESQTAVMRAMYIELMTIGAEGLALRRRMGERFGQFLIMQVEAFRTVEPHKRPLTPTMATAVIGGINELILQAIERGEAHRLSELTPTVTEFVQAVIQSLEAPVQTSA